MKQLSNNNKTVTLKTSTFTYTSSINSITNEIYLESNIGEYLTWELTQENINLVNSAMLKLKQKDGVTIQEDVNYTEDEFTLYETLEDDFTMDEILNAL